MDAALLFKEASAAVEQNSGYALFAGLTGYFGKVTMLLEFKDYPRFQFGRNDSPKLLYHEPPSLERLDQQVPNNSHLMGGRLRLSLDLLEGKTVPFVDALVYLLNDLTDEAMLTGENS